jgi:acetylornithine deacetylase
MQVMAKLKSYVDDLNASITSLPTHGPCSKYELPDEGLKGRLSLKFFDSFTRGVACKLDSEGFNAMVKAFTEVGGRRAQGCPRGF